MLTSYRTMTGLFAVLLICSGCAAPQKVLHVPVAVECPPPPSPPRELMQPLPTLDLVPTDLLPPRLKAQ